MAVEERAERTGRDAQRNVRLEAWWAWVARVSLFALGFYGLWKQISSGDENYFLAILCLLITGVPVAEFLGALRQAGVGPGPPGA